MIYLDFILGFDFGILDFIAQNIRNDILDPIMTGFSMFADKGIGLLILGLILLIPRKTRPAAATAICAMAAALLFGEYLIKIIAQRPRPFITYEAYHGYLMPFALNMGKASGYSFPSGHTSASFAFATAMFKINKKVGIIAVIIACIVGFSRIYNYVHYPTDVFAGMILGIAFGLLAIFLFKKFSIDDKLLKTKKNKVKE